jgi:hypothetical protein
VDEFQTSSIIYWYEELEERLIEFLKFFPFIPPNKDVSSPRIAGVVTETCHILDSLFREVSNPKETIKGKTKKKEKLDVRDYAELYAKRFNLSATKSLMFVSPPQYVIPFKEWEPLTTGGVYKALPWWSAYNRLKHSRIENIKHATLENAVNSLCGLHQVIAKLPELAPATVRHGWFPLHGIDQSGSWYLYTTEEVGKLLTNYSQECESYLIESKLFIVPAGKTIFPGNTPTDLNPDIYYRSPKLSSFLGRGR